jgi:hypothetical protein
LVSINSHGQEFGPVVIIDDERTQITFEVGQDGKLTTWSFSGEFAIGGDDGVILSGLSMFADPDPFLGYAIGITDIGAPSVFGFVFGTPIVPTSPPGTVTTAFSASLTDGGDGAISITPVAPGVPTDSDGVPEIHVATDGFPLTNDGHDLGPGESFVGAPGSAFAHGPFNEAGSMPEPGPWTWMQLNVTFQGSGGNDFYGLTGSLLKVETPSVPEAGSTLLLTLLGLFGCAVASRLRSFAE